MADKRLSQTINLVIGSAVKAAASSLGSVGVAIAAGVLVLILVVGSFAIVIGVTVNAQQQNACIQGQVGDPNAPINAQLTGSTREEQAFHFFVNNGFTEAQSAGIVGNLIYESSLNPSITNSIGAHGLAQWMGYRLLNLQKWAAAQKVPALKDPDNFATQLTFIVHELNTNFASVKIKLQTVTGNTQADVDAAANIWNQYYEISGTSSAPRAALGWAALQRYGNGKVGSSDEPAGTVLAVENCGSVPGAAGPVTTTGWTYPLKPGTYQHTGPDGQYGYRPWPINGFHNGVDLAAPTGTPIYAAHSGIIVQEVHLGGAWGNYLVVQGGGVWVLYPHESRFATGDHVGELVQENQIIGYVGATGHVTGPHLHLTVCTDLSLCLEGSGANGKGSVNPVDFFAARGVTL